MEDKPTHTESDLIDLLKEKGFTDQEVNACIKSKVFYRLKKHIEKEPSMINVYIELTRVKMKELVDWEENMKKNARRIY